MSLPFIEHTLTPDNFEVNWEHLIFQEIADRRMTQAVVAQTYSYLLGRGGVDWHTVNLRIRERWSEAGLIRVKQLAWKRYRQEQKP